MRVSEGEREKEKSEVIERKEEVKENKSQNNSVLISGIILMASLFNTTHPCNSTFTSEPFF